jgi:hypothetical protein
VADHVEGTPCVERALVGGRSKGALERREGRRRSSEPYLLPLNIYEPDSRLDLGFFWASGILTEVGLISGPPPKIKIFLETGHL